MIKTILKIAGSVIIGIIIYFIVETLTSNGTKYYYCISKNKCVTVWKMENGEVYVMLGHYKSRKVPSNNYVKVSRMNTSYMSVILSQSNRLLIDVEDNAKIIKQSSSSLIELYNKNKPLNDSLYTYFDGKYRRYKKEVDYIIIDLKENYATDKNGKKI